MEISPDPSPHNYVVSVGSGGGVSAGGVAVGGSADGELADGFPVGFSDGSENGESSDGWSLGFFFFFDFLLEPEPRLGDDDFPRLLLLLLLFLIVFDKPYFILYELLG